MEDHQIWLDSAYQGLGDDPDLDQLSLSMAHPEAVALIPNDEFLYNVTPLAEDVGADVFAYYRHWMKQGSPGESTMTFLSVVFQVMEVGDYNDMVAVTDNSVLTYRLSSHDQKLRRQIGDEVIIATAFSELFYRGEMTTDVKALAVRALSRESLPVVLDELNAEERPAREKKLRQMMGVLTGEMANVAQP